MLNLKELEKRLDEALANETNESLSSWFRNQRVTNIESFLGVGSVKQFKVNPYKFTQYFPQNIHYSCSNENNPDEQLAKAA